jgi:Na+/H+-dicarboxylate symporter
MTLHKRLASPWLILLCVVLGGTAGLYAPMLGQIGFAIGALYLAVVSMVALPLQVVAGFFGLRQIAALPKPVLRLGMMAGLAVALLLAAALAATLMATAMRPGMALSLEAQAYLGTLVNGSEQETMRLNPDAKGADRSDDGIAVAAAGSSATDTTSGMTATFHGDEIGSHQADSGTTMHNSALADIVPSNFFKTLVDGHLWGILIGTLCFGMAFARLSKLQSQSLSHMLEGAYRTFEIIIDKANLCIPILAFGMTAHLAGQVNTQTLFALGGLIGTFLCTVAVLSAVALLTIARMGGHSLRSVVDALQTPILISLTSGSAIAPVPNAIDAISSHLGYSRAVAELLVPFGTVFIRVGNAVYYACVALFVAALYHYPLGPTALLLIWLGAALAAFLSSGFGSGASVAYIAFVLSFLDLPPDAVVVLLLSIDPLCSGPRNVMSLLSVCALTALASAGLPAERGISPRKATEFGRIPGNARSFALNGNGDGTFPATMQQTVTFVLTRGQLVLALSCAALLATFVLLIGVGVGAR